MADKSFQEMSSEEQKDFLLRQAFGVLEQFFGVYDAKVEWIAYTHNAVFDVTIPDHDYHWVLRLGQPENTGNIASEVEILRSLHNHGLLVPYPEEWLQDNSLSALLLTYVDGNSIDVKAVTNSEMQSIGQFLAKFHAIETPKSLNRPKLDYDGLFSKNGIYYPGDENLHVFSDEQITVMDAVAEKVKLAMDELGQSDDEYGLIHGDLLLKNILFYEGEVRALDFEYCGWGYYLYDLTPLLWQLKPQERYPQLEQALWDGYTRYSTI